MKRFFRYVLALTMPLFMASCEEKPVEPTVPEEEEGKEAFLVIKDAQDVVGFDFGETRTFAIEQSGVKELYVSSPDGWIASVDDELIVTAPLEDAAQEYSEEGLVVITYSGTDGVEKSSSVGVFVDEGTLQDEVTFELIYSNVTSTSAHLEVIPSNNEARYYYDVCTMEDYNSVNGDVGVIIGQYIDYLLAYNPSLTMEDMLNIMLSQGPDSDTVSGLPPGTEMCFYAIAVNDEGETYSEPAVVRFTTEKGGNPADCSFEMTVSEIKGTTVFIEITPSDPSVRYWYAVTPRDGYPGDIPLMVEVKNEAQAYADEVGMTLEEVIKGVTVAGPVAENWYDLEVDTGYYLYAFAMDEQGNSAGPLFKEAFTTAKTDISDADVELTYRYFDGDALYASDPDAFPNAEGRVIVQIYAEPNFYASDWAITPGGIGTFDGDYLTYNEAGEATGFAHWWIGTGGTWREENCEKVEGCFTSALITEYHMQYFKTAPDHEAFMQKYPELADQYLKPVNYWYVYICDATMEEGYVVFLNQEYFSKEDAITLARSIKLLKSVESPLERAYSLNRHMIYQLPAG